MSNLPSFNASINFSVKHSILGSSMSSPAQREIYAASSYVLTDL